VNVSTLIRMRMRQDAVPVATEFDLDADELSFLREDLTLLEDEQTLDDVASWKTHAERQGIFSLSCCNDLWSP
jgi:hypothetical protein